MKTSLNTINAVILALTAVQHVSAVEVVHEYVTKFHTVTGDPPVSTATSTLITATVTSGAAPGSQVNAPEKLAVQAPPVAASSSSSVIPQANAQVNAPEKLAVQALPVAGSSTSPTSSSVPVSSPTSQPPPPVSSPANQVNTPEKLAVNQLGGHNVKAAADQGSSQSSSINNPAHDSHTPASNFISSASAVGQTQTPATVPASAVTSAPVLGNGVMTVKIENHWNDPLSISYEDNSNSPNALGKPGPAALGTATTVVYPTGWAGRIYVGKTDNPANTKIEGSTTGWNDIDVSYVDGYSVPVTCSSNGEAITGCNIDLWQVSGKCDTEVGQQDVCPNPMVSIPDGPSTPWFLPCQGAAYTFPNDNVANNGNTRSDTVTCCIGTKEMGCEAPERQGKGNNKASKKRRSLPSQAEQPMAFKEAVEAHDPVLSPHEAAHTHGHLKRHLHRRRGIHGHAVPRELKDVV